MKILYLLFLFIVVSSNSYSQGNYGIEIPLYYTSSVNSVPGVFTNISSTGGSSYDLGIGFFVKPSRVFLVEAGYHHWNKIFHPTYKGTITINNNIVGVKAEELGVISYDGLYIHAAYEFKSIYAGGGFDISLGNSYKSDLRVYNESGAMLDEINENNKSIFTETFNNQFDLLFMLGANISLSNHVKIKPGFQVSIPLVGLFGTGAYVWSPMDRKSDEAKINIVLLKFGITTEITL